MITLCAPTFDINGSIICPNGYADQQSTSRRAKRVATLDLSAVLIDQGSTVADLTFKLKTADSGDFHAAIDRLITNHSTAILSCSKGCYSVLLSCLQFRNGETTVTAEVLEVA